MIKFKKSILLYVPAFNCEKNILNVLSSIPDKMHDQIDCLVIDNQSSDNTWKILVDNLDGFRNKFNLKIIRTKENIGYAGSQKLAYSIALENKAVKYVAMLHGDGQYDSKFLPDLIEKIKNNYALVNGFRDKKTFPNNEETPLHTYYIIRILNWLENIVTGINCKEWHSGFVIYSTTFLKKIPLDKLSKTPHIDGEFILMANILEKKISSIPIYKKYKDHIPFQGFDRIKHVFNTLFIMLKYRFGFFHNIIKENKPGSFAADYEYYKI